MGEAGTYAGLVRLLRPVTPWTHDPPLPELPIAAFDSGVGGLTVLHEGLVSLPDENLEVASAARDAAHEAMRLRRAAA